MPQVIFLGTNGWYDSGTGNTISVLEKTEKFNIILDAGNGISKLKRYIDHNKRSFLFISHFHLDHVEGLHTLCLNRFPKGLNFILQEGGTGLLNQLMRNPYIMPLSDMPFESVITEVPACAGELPFKASFLEMCHAPVTQGMRMEIDGKTLAYCLDTGYCENAVRLAENADLLIIECTLKSGSSSKTHLNPELCARIAREAGVRKLLLTHFEAESYGDIESRAVAESRVRELFENAVATRDGMTVAF